MMLKIDLKFAYLKINNCYFCLKILECTETNSAEDCFQSHAISFCDIKVYCPYWKTACMFYFPSSDQAIITQSH